MQARQSDLEIRRPVTAGFIWLWVGIGTVGALILLLTVMNFLPVLQSAGTTPDDHKVEIPPFDTAAWRGVPVQHRGRYKPFETAAQEVMREIVGRARLQGKDAVAVVLMWMFDGDPTDAKASVWDDKPFILCEHEELRSLIYRLGADGKVSDQPLAAGQELHGRYMPPADLRRFRDRLFGLKEKSEDSFRELYRPLERQTDEALGRLALYDSIRQGPILSDKKKPADPFAFVALDKVKGSPWFSIGELRFANTYPATWQDVLMKDRVKNAPQMYISPKHKEALAKFQEHVKAGTAGTDIEELETILGERKTQIKDEYLAIRRSGEKDKAFKMLHALASTLPGTTTDGKAETPPEMQATLERIVKLLGQEDKTGVSKAAEIGREVGVLIDQRSARVIQDLKGRLPNLKQGYDPEDPRFRMLHLTYLETRYPEVYKEATAWQPFPAEDASRVVGTFNKVGTAYRSREAGRFTETSQAFLTTIKEVSEKYGHTYPGEDSVADRLGALVSGGTLNTPGESLLNLERTFNRVQPFMWAWVLMLVGVLLLSVGLGLDSRLFHRLGLAFYCGSVLFQIFGFFTRIVISGRPPVTNMYETVIWVAFMTSIFALILEAVYKRKVIALAGAMVSTISLVLADQLPLALDPKINPLVPVLRSNFWLTIHVLTIVSSYAAGALAWGLGNLSLLLILFRSNKRDTIKTLANFTYRALQIAVLLLATGTFLGGWWAAYSWGRFWGWDPKETGALIALLCYVIPLHMRFIGWIKDFGLAVAAVLCFAAILMSWYGINFWIPAGLHSYGFGGGGVGWVFWASLINIEWVLVATLLYRRRTFAPSTLAKGEATPAPEAKAAAEPKSEHVQV